MLYFPFKYTHILILWSYTLFKHQRKQIISQFKNILYLTHKMALKLQSRL